MRLSKRFRRVDESGAYALTDVVSELQRRGPSKMKDAFRFALWAATRVLEAVDEELGAEESTHEWFATVGEQVAARAQLIGCMQTELRSDVGVAVARAKGKGADGAQRGAEAAAGTRGAAAAALEPPAAASRAGKRAAPADAAHADPADATPGVHRVARWSAVHEKLRQAAEAGQPAHAGADAAAIAAILGLKAEVIAKLGALRDESAGAASAPVLPVAAEQPDDGGTPAASARDSGSDGEGSGVGDFACAESEALGALEALLSTLAPAGAEGRLRTRFEALEEEEEDDEAADGLEPGGGARAAAGDADGGAYGDDVGQLEEEHGLSDGDGRDDGQADALDDRAAQLPPFLRGLQRADFQSLAADLAAHAPLAPAPLDGDPGAAGGDGGADGGYGGYGFAELDLERLDFAAAGRDAGGTPHLEQPPSGGSPARDAEQRHDNRPEASGLAQASDERPQAGGGEELVSVLTPRFAPLAHAPARSGAAAGARTRGGRNCLASRATKLQLEPFCFRRRADADAAQAVAKHRESAAEQQQALQALAGRAHVSLDTRSEGGLLRTVSLRFPRAASRTAGGGAAGGGGGGPFDESVYLYSSQGGKPLNLAVLAMGAAEGLFDAPGLSWAGMRAEEEAAGARPGGDEGDEGDDPMDGGAGLQPAGEGGVDALGLAMAALTTPAAARGAAALAAADEMDGDDTHLFDGGAENDDGDALRSLPPGPRGLCATAFDSPLVPAHTSAAHRGDSAQAAAAVAATAGHKHGGSLPTVKELSAALLSQAVAHSRSLEPTAPIDAVPPLRAPLLPLALGSSAAAQRAAPPLLLLGPQAADAPASAAAELEAAKQRALRARQLVAACFLAATVNSSAAQQAVAPEDGADARTGAAAAAEPWLQHEAQAARGAVSAWLGQSQLAALPRGMQVCLRQEEGAAPGRIELSLALYGAGAPRGGDTAAAADFAARAASGRLRAPEATPGDALDAASGSSSTASSGSDARWMDEGDDDE